jgi:hypothetical protein
MFSHPLPRKAALPAALSFLFLTTASLGAAENKPTFASLPEGAIDAQHAFVVAANGQSFLFNPSAGVSRLPFLDNVFQPFGFSSDSRYFLYLKSNGRLPSLALYRYDLSDGSEKRVTDLPVFSAAWSPASPDVAFLTLDSVSQLRLFLLDTVSGQTRQIASGMLDADLLSWSPDGSTLTYAILKPQSDNYFHEGIAAQEFHRYDAASGSDSVVDDTEDAAVRSATPANTRRSRQFATTSGAYITAQENNRSVVKHWNQETGAYETVAKGHIYASTRDGVVVREFSAGGVSFAFASGASSGSDPMFAFTGAWRLPFEGSADLTQGGALFSGGACDGRACNIISHTNLLGYGLDFQQRANAGQGSAHILATEEGTVVGVTTNVTCNSAYSTCTTGPDPYNVSCASVGGAGNTVVIAHPDGSYTLHAHMRSGTSPLTVGQAVVRGTYLGDQGHTGAVGPPAGTYNGCGDHIHFQRQTGPVVWSQSVPTDFQETPCTLSCRTTYTSQNSEASPSVNASALTVQLIPSTLIAGSSSPASRVLLAAPAPAGGTVVTLSSSNADVTVPASVVVPAGSRVATFNISSNPAAAAANVTITANDGTSTATATLTLNNLRIYGITINPTTITAGATSTANEVVLTGPTPSGATIGLTSDTAAAGVPSTVSVPAAGSSVLFPITTTSIPSTVVATITASVGTSSAWANVIVAPLTLNSVGLSSGSAVGGTTVFGNRLNFSGAAIADTVVSLSTSDSNLATVPATVILTQGSSFVNFTITTFGVASATPVTITATYNGQVRTAVLTLNPLTLQAITPARTTASGGSTVNATVTLTGPGLTGGTVVSLLSSDTTLATVPATVTVAAGATTSANFAISTSFVASSTPVTITASLNGSTRSFILTLTPVTPSSVALFAFSTVGGNSVPNNRINLGGPAGPGDQTVTLTSSNPAVASVPTSVIVTAGTAASAAFPITTSNVAVSTPVNISATLNGVTVSATLTVSPLSVSALTLSATTAVGGVTVTGNRVTLNGPAGASGAVVSLSSSDTTQATVPATVTVAAGGTQAFFPITTLISSNVGPVTITATLNGVARTATITINSVTVQAVTLSATNIAGGASLANNTVTLNGPAGSSGLTVNLSSSNPAVASVPATVTVAAGATVSPAFPITTSPVAASTPITITATYNSTSVSTSLTVAPISLISMTLSTSSTVGGATVTANRVNLNGPAPTGGIAVTLASSDTNLATVPATVTVPAGASQAQFSITTVPVAAASQVTITASFNGVNRPANLTLSPVNLASVALAATSATGGATVSFNRVNLNGPAPTGGVVVNLSTSDSNLATVPATVTVPAGSSFGNFPITTFQVAAVTPVTISANFNGVIRNGNLTLNPLAMTNATMASTGVGGTAVTGTVTLNGPAGPAGAVISLGSSDTNTATVPATVTVPAGATQTTFQVTSVPVASATPVVISVSFGGATRNLNLTLNPIAPAFITLASSTVVGGNNSTNNRVNLNGFAAPGGTVVTLTSSDPTIANPPATVTVAAGSVASPAFTIPTFAVAANTPVTITATIGSVSVSTVLNVQVATPQSVSLTATTVKGGASFFGNRVNFTGPAPAGAVITLTSSDPAIASVAATVTPAAGATFVNFPVNTFATVSANTLVTITATWNGVSRSASFTVTP